MPPWLSVQGDSALIRLKVLPNAPRSAVGEPRGPELVVRIAAAPDKGKANEELARFLSGQLDVPRSRIELVSGRTARHKVLRVPAEAILRWSVVGSP